MNLEQLVAELGDRQIDHDIDDTGAILCQVNGLQDVGLGLALQGPYLEWWSYEAYSGSLLSQGWCTTLNEAIASAIISIVSFDVELSLSLATFK